MSKLVTATSEKNRLSDKNKQSNKLIECGSNSVLLPYGFANGFKKRYQVSNHHALTFLTDPHSHCGASSQQL